MAAAKKSDDTKSTKGAATRLWVNCSLRPAGIPSYGDYEKVTPELKQRLTKPGEVDKIEKSFIEKVVKPFEAVEFPIGASLQSKSRNLHGAFVPSRNLEPGSILARAQTVDTNIGFLPAAEEGEEIVPVVVVYRRAADSSKRFHSLRHVPDGMKKVDISELRGRLPRNSGLDVLVFAANRKWEDHPGVGRHSEEQAFAVIAAMIEEDTILAYLRHDTRPRVQKFGQAVAAMRRRERADRGMRAVKRQRDAASMI